MKNGHFKMSKNGFSNFRISKKLQKSSDESIMLLFKLQKKSFYYCKIFKYFLKRTCAYFMCCQYSAYLATKICKKICTNFTVKNVTIVASESFYGSNTSQPKSIIGNARQR